MNKDFLEEQQNLASKRLEDLKDVDGIEKQNVSVVSEYLSSLLHPENYSNAQKEDLRKLALELGYTEDIKFEKWVIPVRES